MELFSFFCKLLQFVKNALILQMIFINLSFNNFSCNLNTFNISNPQLHFLKNLKHKGKGIPIPLKIILSLHL